MGANYCASIFPKLSSAEQAPVFCSSIPPRARFRRTSLRYRFVRVLFRPRRSGRVFLGGARRVFCYTGALPQPPPLQPAISTYLPSRLPLAPAGACPPQPRREETRSMHFFAPIPSAPASRTFRGYSRLRREITSIPMPKRTKGISCAFLHFMREK